MTRLLPILLFASIAFADDLALIEEHVYKGLPSSDNLLVRNAYVVDYDHTKKAPRWVAYRLIEDYRDTPARKGKWKTYRADPDIDTEPKEEDYKGAYYDTVRNYARGHLAH